MRIFLHEMTDAHNVIKLINVLVPVTDEGIFGILKKGVLGATNLLTNMSSTVNDNVCGYYNEFINMFNTDRVTSKFPPNPEDMIKLEGYLKKIYTNFNSMKYQSSIDASYEMLTSLYEFGDYDHPQIYIEDANVGDCNLVETNKTLKTLVIDLKWAPRISLILQPIGRNKYKTELLLEKGAFSKFLNSASDAGNNIRQSLGGTLKKLIDSANDIPIKSITIGFIIYEEGGIYKMYLERNGCPDTMILIGSTERVKSSKKKSTSVDITEDDKAMAMGGISMNRKGKKTKGKKVKDKKTKGKKSRIKKTKQRR